MECESNVKFTIGTRLQRRTNNSLATKGNTERLIIYTNTDGLSSNLPELDTIIEINKLDIVCIAKS